VDGALAPLPCASVKFYRRCDDCEDEKTCEVRRLMREVRDAASAILDNTSLAEAAASNAPKRKPKKLEKAR
jgi:DNA-binding IscR family transcriptional regulator